MSLISMTCTSLAASDAEKCIKVPVPKNVPELMRTFSGKTVESAAYDWNRYMDFADMHGWKRHGP